MAKLLLDILDVLSIADSHAGVAMPNAVKRDSAQLRFLQGSVEVPLDHVLVDRWLPFWGLL